MERADREQDSTLLLAGVGWNFYRGFRLGVGFGRKDPADEREFVSRLALAYEFELGRAWFIKPYLAKDFIKNEDNEEVFGAYVGRGF